MAMQTRMMTSVMIGMVARAIVQYLRSCKRCQDSDFAIEVWKYTWWCGYRSRCSATGTVCSNGVPSVGILCAFAFWIIVSALDLRSREGNTHNVRQALFPQWLVRWIEPSGLLKPAAHRRPRCRDDRGSLPNQDGRLGRRRRRCRTPWRASLF